MWAFFAAEELTLITSLAGLDVSLCLGNERRLADLYGDDLSSHHVLVIRSFLLFGPALVVSSPVILYS